MKQVLVSLLLFFFSQMLAQNISEINKNIGISDSLTNEKEIRIYKWFNTINGSEVFRLSQNENGIWISEIYRHYNPVDKKDKPKFVKSELKPKVDSNLFWLYVVASDVQFLPNLQKIRYKLKGDAEFILDGGEYQMSRSMKRPLDGTSYQAIFKDGNQSNSFEFDNYSSYLKIYPNVDELNAYAKLIDLIKNEFDIWQQ